MSDLSDRRGGEPSGGVSFSYRELIATGLAETLLAFLAAQWALPGVLLGALSPMASLVIMAIIKAYSSGAGIGGPTLPGLLYILTAFWWFASRPAEVRQSILLAGLCAGAASSIISASAVVGTQEIAGEDLTCLIWEECHRGIFPPPVADAGKPYSPSGETQPRVLVALRVVGLRAWPPLYHSALVPRARPFCVGAACRVGKHLNPEHVIVQGEIR